jgi:hypothetical protein
MSRPPAHQKVRIYATSDDGGHSFGAYRFAQDLEEPTCMAGLINFDGTLYVCSNCIVQRPAQANFSSNVDTWGCCGKR